MSTAIIYVAWNTEGGRKLVMGHIKNDIPRKNPALPSLGRGGMRGLGGKRKEGRVESRAMYVYVRC